VVDGRSQTWAGRLHAVSGRPMLINTHHAVLMPRCAVALKSRFQNGMVQAWHGRGIEFMYQTWPHCVNQMVKTHSAWERHGMCELAFRGKRIVDLGSFLGPSGHLELW
jgi:hypothetical protein